jgi:hypothetical protein
VRATERRAVLRPTHGENVDLSRYDGKSFAIVLNLHGQPQVLRGTAHYAHDENLGNVLRIELAGEDCGQPAFILAEDKWSGSILPGADYGCDFCIPLAS